MAWNSVYADCELEFKLYLPERKQLKNTGGSGVGVWVLSLLHLPMKALTNLMQMAKILTTLGSLNFVGNTMYLLSCARWVVFDVGVLFWSFIVVKP